MLFLGIMNGLNWITLLDIDIRLDIMECVPRSLVIFETYIWLSTIIVKAWGFRGDNEFPPRRNL